MILMLLLIVWVSLTCLTRLIFVIPWKSHWWHENGLPWLCAEHTCLVKVLLDVVWYGHSGHLNFRIFSCTVLALPVPCQNCLQHHVNKKSLMFSYINDKSLLKFKLFYNLCFKGLLNLQVKTIQIYLNVTIKIKNLVIF